MVLLDVVRPWAQHCIDMMSSMSVQRYVQEAPRQYQGPMLCSWAHTFLLCLKLTIGNPLVASEFIYGAKVPNVSLFENPKP